MSSPRVYAAEKDLEKFIKFLALKSAQVVVQSRLGEKMQTNCNPLGGNDWFNIVVEDHPDVYTETKRVMSLGHGESILQRLPLCIEISLKTMEGDQMILEVWSLDLQSSVQMHIKDNNKSDCSNLTEQQCLKATHAIYNRMGILLKSVISLTRATPAYKLSRQQTADSYSIYYRIYLDQVEVNNLGDDYKFVRIGQLNTIVGNLIMSLAYRTKMTITSSVTTTHNRAQEMKPLNMDSNYFNPSDISPKRVFGIRKISTGILSEKKIVDIEKPLRPGAFVEVSKLRQYTEGDYVLPETPLFEWLIRRPRHESADSTDTGGSIDSLLPKSISPVLSPLRKRMQAIVSNNSVILDSYIVNQSNNNYILQSAKSCENYQIAERKQEQNQQQNANVFSTIQMQSTTRSLFVPVSLNGKCGSETIVTQIIDDDNLLKELNFPFASSTSHVNDLAKFYRDCYYAPRLCGRQFEISGNGSIMDADSNNEICSANKELSRQLEQFEASLEDYDKLVASLGICGSSSTGSIDLQMSN